MRSILFFTIFFLILGCSTTPGVYWCGDHACINKNEREAYFKKTMIVEIRELKKENIKKNSEIENITQRAKNEEKKRITREKELAKQAKLDEKRRIKDEKELAKQAKLDEKRRIDEEKELEKQITLEEEKRIKEDKKLTRQVKMKEKVNKKQTKTPAKKDNKITDFENVPVFSTEFDKIVKRIKRRNILRPYPDINDIQN